MEVVGGARLLIRIRASVESVLIRQFALQLSSTLSSRGVNSIPGDHLQMGEYLKEP